MISSRRSRSLPLVLTLILLAISPAFAIFDCCEELTAKKFKASQVGMFESYYHQDPAGVCDTEAIVFTVNLTPCGKPKRVSLCADPKQNWVNNMITAINKQRKKSKKQQQRRQRKKCKRAKKNYA